MLHHADDSNFQSEVLSHPGTVLVEFFTPTCQPCRQLEPWLRNLAQQFHGRLKVVKVDSTRSPMVSNHFGVRMAPTLIVFRGGQAMQAIQGKPPSPNRLVTFVQPYL
ncbi:MAG: thioredoxin family protein [Planctomycetota bacterium]